MQNKLSHQLVHAITLASEEAVAFGSERVQVEHLLIGLFRLENGEELNLPDLSVDQIRRAAETMTGNIYLTPRDKTTQIVELAESAEGSLRIAHQVMTESKATSIEPRHLLVALASPDCECSRELLLRLGVDLSQFVLFSSTDNPKSLLERSPATDALSSETLRARITAWGARAEMAGEQGRSELVESALCQKAEYEQKLQTLLNEQDSE